MNWKANLYWFTQVLFFISIVWFFVGLIIVGSKHWWVLIIVPFYGLIALGYWVDYRYRYVSIDWFKYGIDLIR